MNDSGDEPLDLIEDLVAQCVERGGGAHGAAGAAVESVCASHPELAGEVRACLARLAAVGMLEAGGLDGSAPKIEGYTLLERLGAGGMGVVFAARDEASGALVALKTADPRVAWSPRASERFRREIEAAKRLRHPHVVSIRAVGEARGVPYYAMDFVPGATLGALLDELRRSGAPSESLAPADLQRAWSTRRAELHVAGSTEPRGAWGRTYVEIVARFALEVAEALEHAHSHGVVHRDVKPNNVLIDADGRARLFDLGLAHLADDPRLTRTGDFAGSPQYAAPEQVSGGTGAIDQRTDVHGVGVTLFELIALRPPFQGKTTPELLRKIQREEAPPLRQAAPWAPRELETICAVCLEKDPRQRYAGARELAEDLRRFLGFLPIRARRVGALRRGARFARRNPAPTVAAALALLILIASPLALWLHGLSIAEQRDHATAAAAEARREADENREVSHFLESLILRLDDSADPAHRGAARELIERARARLAEEATLQPLTRASLFHTVASVLAGMGREIDSIPLLDRSLSIREGMLGESHADTVTTIAELAELHLRLSNLASARGLAERGMRAAEAVEASGRPRALAAEVLGRVELASGNLEAAEMHLADAVERFQALAAAGESGFGASADQARALRALASAQYRRGELESAERHALAAAALEAAAWQPDVLAQAEGMEILAEVRAARGDQDGAASYLTEALHLYRKRGPSLAARTEALLERLVPLQERRLARGASGLAGELALELVLLGELRAQSGTDGASGVEPALSRALDLAERAGAPDALDADLVGRAHLGLARAYLDAELQGAALASIDAARAVQAKSGTPEPWVADLFELSLRLAAERGDAERAGAEAEVARRWFEERLAAVTPSRELLSRARAQALLLLELGRAADAEELLRRADQAEQRIGGGEEPLGLALAGLEEDAFAKSMQEGVTLLQARQFAQAARAFETCRALRPSDPIAWYNLACAEANQGRADAALDALLRAVELGYAYRDRAEELTAADPDLEPLRGDPRFALVLERIRSLCGAAEAYAAAAEVYVPPGLAPDAKPPLLVVLHGNGETKRSVVEGPWREVADALGFVLLAPSGRIPAGIDPKLGMLWADDLVRYGARTWYYEKPVRDAVAELRRTRPVDPERIFLAGEDLGGTLAFNIAVHATETYRGCLLVDAVAPLDLAADVAPSLGSLGLRVALLADIDRRPPGMPRGRTAAEHLSSTFRQLGEWGLDTTLATSAGGAAPAEVPRLVEAMRFLETGRERAHHEDG